MQRCAWVHGCVAHGCMAVHPTRSRETHLGITGDTVFTFRQTILPRSLPPLQILRGPEYCPAAVAAPSLFPPHSFSRYYGDLNAALRQWQLQCRTARSPPSIRGGGGGGGGGFPVNVLNELFSIEGSALLQV